MILEDRDKNIIDLILKDKDLSLAAKGLFMMIFLYDINNDKEYVNLSKILSSTNTDDFAIIRAFTEIRKFIVPICEYFKDPVFMAILMDAVEDHYKKK